MATDTTTSNRVLSRYGDAVGGSVGADEIVRRLAITEADLLLVRRFGAIVLPRLADYNTLFYAGADRETSAPRPFSDFA